MITLLELNEAVCGLYRQALDAAGVNARLVAEDVRRPILRPSGKVELEDGSDVFLLASGRERTATFRLYYFARDEARPKLENLAVREAVAAAFAGGVAVGERLLFPEEGVSFTVTDGVLVATMELVLDEAVPEDKTAELMETLEYDRR